MGPEDLLEKRGEGVSGLSQDALHHLTLDVGEAVVAALEPEGKALVIKAQLVQERCLKV